MRARVAVVAVLLVNGAAIGTGVWLAERALAVAPLTSGGNVWTGAALGSGWSVTGAVLAWLRARNVLGWLLLGVGTCQVLSLPLDLYGSLGVAVAEPQWPLARWSAWVGSAIWLPGLLPLANLLPAFYPHGRLPGRGWRWPVAAAATGIVLVTVAFLLDPAAYDDIAPGPSPVAAPGVAIVAVIAGAVTLLPGTLAIWVLSAVRLARARAPERQQLAWLFFAIVPFFLTVFALELPAPVTVVAGMLVPAAVGVGVLRYNLLGIEVVLRRGLVYAVLTAAVAAVYLGLATAGGAQLAGGSLSGVVAAAVIAVGLTPVRDRLQRAVDRLVYGERRDPLLAVTRLADRLSADEPDLLPAVLGAVAAAVRAPGATVAAADGRLLATHGRPADGPDFPLRIAGRDIGTLHLAARRPGERYTAGDRRLLAALMPQVAAVLHATDLAEALEAARDRAVAATRAERDRLRRDLHDGLGPAIAGVRLGLRAADDAAAAGRDAEAGQLLERIRAEVDSMTVEIRRILDGLRPAALDDAGLAQALRRQATALGDALAVDLVVADLPPLHPDVEAAAYRIAQEALTNVLRHAGATRAQVTLTAGRSLTVEISDDGTGLDPSGRDGVGLESMRRRAESLGGTLAVAASERGTTVVATLPLPEAST